MEAVETGRQKNLQKPVPRAAVAYGRQLKNEILNKFDILVLCVVGRMLLTNIRKL